MKPDSIPIEKIVGRALPEGGCASRSRAVEGSVSLDRGVGQFTSKSGRLWRSPEFTEEFS